MNQSTYTAITGKTISNGERFKFLAAEARQTMERMLGWPLNPDKWDDQYLEIGKSRNECACSGVDTSELDDPDTVQGSTRLYAWDPDDTYLTLDPFRAIYSIKLVVAGGRPDQQEGITYRTFDPAHCRPEWINGNPTWGRTVALKQYDPVFGHYPYIPGWSRLRTHYQWCDANYQLAVDADWGLGTECPLELKRVWAELIAYQANPKRNVRSESVTSHSYSKFNDDNPEVRFKGVLAQYAGPNGAAYVPTGFV